MKKKILIILSLLAVSTIGLSDLNTGFEFYKRNFETSALIKTPIYPLAGIGTKIDFSYKIYRDYDNDVYLLAGAGMDYTYFKNIIKTIPKDVYHNLAFYGDLRAIGNVGVPYLSMYGGASVGILTEFTKAQLYAGAYLGLKYRFLTFELGGNTSNYAYLGLGVKF